VLAAVKSFVKNNRRRDKIMELKQIDSYTRHGCNIVPEKGESLWCIEYFEDVTNHEFNGAYGSGGIFEKLERAREKVKDFDGYKEYLAIPDLVFSSKALDVNNA
jgi:hypothetical protein